MKRTPEVEVTAQPPYTNPDECSFYSVNEDFSDRTSKRDRLGSVFDLSETYTLRRSTGLKSPGSGIFARGLKLRKD